MNGGTGFSAVGITWDDGGRDTRPRFFLFQEDGPWRGQSPMAFQVLVEPQAPAPLPRKNRRGFLDNFFDRG